MGNSSMISQPQTSWQRGNQVREPFNQRGLSGLDIGEPFPQAARMATTLNFHADAGDGANLFHDILPDDYISLW
jgi:hypothetical protein